MSRFSRLFLVVLTLTPVLAPPAAEAQDKLDPNLQPYEVVSGVDGNLSSMGSDTLNNLMTLWTEGFKKRYPNVKIQVEGKGSSTAPPALIQKTAQLGPMSRQMKSTEIDEFEKEFGYKPTAIAVAIDALAVYVHRDNPLEKLTLAQVDAVFSKARKRGFETDIAIWGDLGLGDAMAKQPIRMYGRNSASGTYGFFKKRVLDEADFKDNVKEQPGSASVVQSVGKDPYGIGYSGIGYNTSGVRALALAEHSGAEFALPTADAVKDRKYPLARMLYVYVNHAPNKPLEPLVRELLLFALSKEGQEIVLKDGYLPLAEKGAQRQRALLRAGMPKKTTRAKAASGGASPVVNNSDK